MNEGYAPPFKGGETAKRAGWLILVAMLLAVPAFTAQKSAQKKEEDFFKKWLDEDVVYIITKDELAAAKRLSTPEEQDSFIQAFWERRDPTPGTVQNEYKDEHYRRIAIANERYTEATIGWRTDRGKMYIRFGQPDNLEHNDSAGSTTMRSGENHMLVPFETWEYRNLPGIGYVKLTFVDRKMNGVYELTLNPADKLAKFSNEDLRLVASNPNNLTTLSETPDSLDWATRVDKYIALQRPPEIKFKDLKTMVNVRLNYNILPYSVRCDMLRGPGDKSLIPITFQFDPLAVAFKDSGDGKRASINVYGVVTDLSGRVAYEFEDAVTLNDSTYFQRFIALDPGRYRLSTVAKDTVSGNTGTNDQVVAVPRTQNKLRTSSLILSDILVPVGRSETSLDNFVISRYKVRPLVKAEISRTIPLGIYQEIYDYATDPNTNQPDLSVVVQLFKKGQSAEILNSPVTTDEMKERYNDRLLFAKKLKIGDLAPGDYIVRLTVRDKVKNELVVSEAAIRLKE